MLRGAAQFETQISELQWAFDIVVGAPV